MNKAQKIDCSTQVYCVYGFMEDVWVFEVGGDILSVHSTKEEAVDAMETWRENKHDS